MTETQQNKRLDSILNDAPQSEQQVSKSFTQKAKAFCFSKVGIACVVFISVFSLLLLLQPSYIFKKRDNNEFSLKYVNFAVVVGVSTLAVLLVLVIPFLITKKIKT